MDSNEIIDGIEGVIDGLRLQYQDCEKEGDSQECERLQRMIRTLESSNQAIGELESSDSQEDQAPDAKAVRLLKDRFDAAESGNTDQSKAAKD